MKFFIPTLLFLFAGMAHADITSDAQKLDDAGLLSRIHAINQGEVKLSTMALQKNQSATIITYARKITKDHTDADQMVMTVAQSEKIQIGHVVPVSAEEAARIQEHQESGKKIAAKQGKDFETDFLGMMIKGHQEALAYLTAAQPKNQRVQTLIQTLIPTIREHLALAQQL